jgi:aspartyl protease family protein
MNGVYGPELIWGIIMLVLVASSIWSHRMPIGQFVRYALIWAALFVGVYGLVLFQEELGEFWARAKVDLLGDTSAQVVGTTTQIRQSSDGHFRVSADVDGRTFEFLIDSGATSSFLSQAAAAELGLNVQRETPGVIFQTANGPISAWPVEVTVIRAGTIEMRAMRMMVSNGDNSVNILGMDWLNKLGSWRVERGIMTIEP